MENFCDKCAEEKTCKIDKSKLSMGCCKKFKWKKDLLRNYDYLKNSNYQSIIKSSEITEMIKAINELYDKCSSQSLVDDLLIIATKHLTLVSMPTVYIGDGNINNIKD